ncbi:MAG: cytochrome c-type biogenesis protein CcmH [Roseibaca calidilacus]|uniref:Cytochrome c-type biogenesis protein CcmH n=1 Tax=Roseibaca calidilacus TaxID=1666912 RepID=A0A0P7W4V9_9RHOB|nr:c-type cytochrome biogenesis protein CcmI [Roseibaca calidilacus]KPP91694.1 MAG: cytochrome c-type biogenesis protein CcmH [Roseibaca calidilacus]CUX82676.1 cytochrome c-type biogenesis protein CcmH [Roseibaca calidilacus]
MTFGQIAGFGVMILMVGIVLWRAVLRAGRQTDAANGYERAMRVYRDQLAEIDRDLARGVLVEDEAERTKLEVQRRILELDRTARGDLQGAASGSRIAVLGVVAVALLGAVGVYWSVGVPNYPDMPLVQRHAEAQEARANRPRQAELEASYAEAFPGPFDFPGRDDLEPMVQQLREALVTRPEDMNGFRLLAQNEVRLGNFRAAIEAQLRVIELSDDRVPVEDLAYLLDLMALATGGIVSPEQESVIERILRSDPEHPIALYYSGRLYAQTGRPDLTFRLWRRLHDVSEPDAPWLEEIRAALPELAQISGAPRYQLPPPPSARGPSAADIEAAEDMTPEQRQEMIAGMVDGMLSRLANEGGPPQDWAQLLRAMGVLERREQALAILGEARTIFAADAAALKIINDAARDAGLTDE